MNWLNRTSLTLALAAIACCQGDDDFRTVAAKDYGSPACWTDSDGDFVSFLTFSNSGDTIIPYLISAKCLVQGGYSSDGESVLLNINTARVIEPTTSFEQAFPHKKLASPTPSDQPLPSSASKIYYIKARGGYRMDGKRTHFQPSAVVRLRDMGMHFDHFLGLSREGRADFLKAAEHRR